MQGMTVIEGDFSPQAETVRYGIVVARVYDVDSLLAGAVDTLIRHGINQERIDIVKVPSAYELPLAAQAMAINGEYDAIIALGAVIHGEMPTPPFDYVAGEVIQGLVSVGLDNELPVVLGVLNKGIRQYSNKDNGAEAALTAYEMVSLLRKIRI